MCGGTAPNRHGHLPRSKWRCLLFRVAVERGEQGVYAFKVECFVDDITACMEHRKKELAGTAEMVLIVDRKREGSEVVDHRRGKRREEQDDCVAQLLGKEVSTCSYKEGVGLSTSVEKLGVDLRTRTK